MNELTQSISATLRERVWKPSNAYRTYVLIVLLLVGTASWADRQVFSIVLESIKHEFSFSDTQLGLLGGLAFGIFYATVGLPVAWLADRYNRRSIIAGALALWSGMTALCGLANGFGSLFLARMGVGIGEAGGAPPSQSLVSDYFEPERRGFAMGVLYSFIPFGYFIALLVGGYMNEALGWRTTFIAVGLPGLVLALLVYTTVREPRRGLSESIARAGGTPSLPSTIRYFLSRPALRHLPLAGAIHGIGAFGASVWMPAYFMRTHGMTSGEIGTALAIIMGGMGLCGTLSGGYITDRLAKRTGDSRWYMWGPALVLAVSVPFTVLVYWWPTATGALLFYCVAALINHMILGPVVATTQNLAGVQRRSMCAAFYLFLVNLISMGLGPLIVGALSDIFGKQFGADSLRYSLMVLVAGTCAWAALHFTLAARTVREDIERAKET